MKRFRLENRTGRVISLGRLTLALFILLAVTVPNDNGGASPDLTEAISLVYTALAALLLLVSWSNWWVEHRLKLPSHLIDLLFLVALDLSIGLNATGPFFLFFVFIVLSAGAKWGWRGALLTAIGVTLLLVVETGIERSAGSLSSDDYALITVRAGHLLVISLMISWFGLTHLGGRRGADTPFPDSKSPEPPIRHAVEHLAECLQSDLVALVWSDAQEPWVHLAIYANGEFRAEQASPATFPWLVAPELDGDTFLFDVARRRALFPRRRWLHARSGGDVVNPELAEHLGLLTGLATPLNAENMEGYFLAGQIEGMCWDDLPVARKSAVEITRAFNRSAALKAVADASVDRTRLAIARDLHDSVAQLLAGLGLKLRAARMTPGDAPARETELQSIEEELVRYQAYLHEFIGDLRHPAGAPTQIDLNDRLKALADELRRQWQVDIRAFAEPLAMVPGKLDPEIAHIVREAAANAVRHGGATRIRMSASRDGASVRLVFEDNGRGFPEPGRFDDPALSEAKTGPRSILERAHLLGGTVGVVSSGEGTIVTVLLPVRSQE